jgi:CHRD domain
MRTKLALFVLTAATVTLVAASVAIGAKPTPTTTFKLKASLNIGQEKPVPKGTKLGASGRFTATLKGTELTWRLTFTHLSGPATAAHIHKGLRKVAGPVVIPLCGPCTSPVTGGPTTLTADQVKDLLSGKYYVNVHTAKNPGGEVRGQITKAPTH